MNTIDLRSKWKTLSQTESHKGYKSAILSSKCAAEIFIGVNSLKNHCLLLALPKSYRLDFGTIKKERISITFYSQQHILVLELHDNLYYDIFDDLIISLYYAIKDIKKVDTYTKKIIQTFNRWSDFFEDASDYLLSKEEVKGLYGELYVLKNMINESTSSTIGEILLSWRGLYDGPYDFVTDIKNIEVKTKNLTKNIVNISSEYQLENENYKNIELLVLSVIEDIINGVSVRDLVEQIKTLVFAKSGDFSIVLKAFKQKGITQNNIIQYDNYRFISLEQIVYDCDREGFPRLVKSNTHKAISKIRYSLELNHLSTFILSTRKFSD